MRQQIRVTTPCPVSGFERPGGTQINILTYTSVCIHTYIYIHTYTAFLFVYLHV